MTAPRLVNVYLDWQNVYKRAREAFGSGHMDPVTVGQVDPVDLSYALMQKHAAAFNDASGYDLNRIYIYRGRPLQSHDQRGYDAFRRQEGAWRRNNKIQTRFRDLRYPDDWGQEGCTDRPREKGVDVQLAVDVITHGIDGEYGVAIVMSADYDLVPALEYCLHRRKFRQGPDVVVAAWRAALTRGRCASRRRSSRSGAIGSGTRTITV
jgi:hypothetical protein